MKVKLDNLFAKRFETKVNGQSSKTHAPKAKSDSKLWRNVMAYWLLGLTTEFGYVLIISAAHDILQSFGTDSNVIYSFSTDGARLSLQFDTNVCLIY